MDVSQNHIRAHGELQQEAPELFAMGEVYDASCCIPAAVRMAALGNGRWTYYVELGRWLQQHGADIYLSGGPEEKAKSARIASQLRSGGS